MLVVTKAVQTADLRELMGRINFDYETFLGKKAKYIKDFAGKKRVGMEMEYARIFFKKNSGLSVCFPGNPIQQEKVKKDKKKKKKKEKGKRKKKGGDKELGR